MLRVLSFGDRIESGDYQVHSRFSEAVNFIQGGRLVSAVGSRIGGGPINIVVAGVDFSRVGRLTVREDGFALDGRTCPKTPLFDSAFPGAGTDREPVKRNLRFWRGLLRRKAHPKSLVFLLDQERGRDSASGFEQALARRFQDAAKDLRRGNLEAGARAASGAGFGLTPSGDDFLSGYLWGLHFRKRLCGGDFYADIERICGCASGANPLSSAFLRCAREGRLFERLRDLLAALCRGAPVDVEGRTDEVLAVGETSGADMCAGLLLAMEKEGSLWS